MFINYFGKEIMGNECCGQYTFVITDDTQIYEEIVYDPDEQKEYRIKHTTYNRNGNIDEEYLEISKDVYFILGKSA